MALRDLLLALFVMIVWAANFIFAKVVLYEVQPLLATGIRFLITALMILFLVKPPKKYMGQLFLLSLTLGIGHFGVLFIGMRFIDAGTTSLALMIEVPIASVLAAIFFREHLSLRLIIGTILAIFGVFLIAGEPNILANPSSFALILVAAFAWGVANLQMKKLAKVGSFTLNGWLCFFSMFHMFILSYFLETNQIEVLKNISWTAIGGIFYMVVGSTMIGYGIWYRLLGKYNVNQVVPIMLLLPVFTLMLSVIFLGEDVTMLKVLGGSIILSGVGLVIIKKQKVDPAAA